MNIQVNWGDIKDGYCGFEKMALEYIKSRFSYPNWEKTKETRDGNKDAVAFIMGYQPDPDKTEQWWMEAKYSGESKMMSRYRLDATIVSAILEDNVSKIFFVTNILVRAKAILDIKAALLKSINCSEVIFCSRYALEHWLSEDIERYRSFFDLPIGFDGELLAPQKPYVIQEAEFFGEVESRLVFKEPLHELQKGKAYICYFQVYSPEAQTLKICTKSRCKGIQLLGNKSIFLGKGENQVQFRFQITEKYALSSGLHMGIDRICFVLGDLDIPPAYPVTVMDNVLPVLCLPSQQRILKKLKQSLHEFIKKNTHSCHTVIGPSGVGKSHLTNALLTGSMLNNEYLFHVEFSDSTIINSRALADLALFLLFPFMKLDQLDEAYISSITSTYISDTIVELVKCRNDYDALRDVLMRSGGIDPILPHRTSMNRRIVILDDAQKLDEPSMRFLLKLLVEIQKYHLPVCIILLGQPILLQNFTYEKLIENCLVQHHNYRLDFVDIFEALHPRNESALSPDDFTHSLDFTVIELFLFTKYIYDEQKTLESIEDFIMLFKVFQKSSILESHVLEQFKRLFASMPECRALCDNIYWSCSPVEFAGEYEKMHKWMPHLIRAGLARYNSQDKVVPIHDSYVKLYRAHFKAKAEHLMLYSHDHPEYMRNCMCNEYRPSVIRVCVERIIALSKMEKHHTVLHILQNIFESAEKTSLEEKLGKDQYLQLYSVYAYAAHQQSTSSNIQAHFRELINRTKNSASPIQQTICLRSTWELTVSSYDWLKYAEVEQGIKKMVKIIQRLQLAGALDRNILRCIKFHDAMVIKTLIESDRQIENVIPRFKRRAQVILNHGFIYRYHNFRVRFALTLPTVDIHKCITYLDEERGALLDLFGYENKMYIWAEFHYHYYDMIWRNKSTALNQALHFHEQMKKEQYNNYRKRLFAIASYYYMKEDMVNGNRFLFTEILFEREMSPRSLAFYQETIALYELKMGNLAKARKSLEVALTFFAELDGYRCVPEHNLVLILGNQEVSAITFWFGESMKSDVYYLDPRIAW